METPKPKITARKRRDNKTKSTEKNSDSVDDNNAPTSLTKEQLQAKLRDKLRNKQTSRLSRPARDNLMEKLEDKMKDAKGKDKMKLKKQIKELEDIEDKEMNNEGERTIPSFD